jgi:hypothetical protein
MISLGRLALPGALCMLALSMNVRPVETGIAPVLQPASPATDDAHCGCGEGKMARVAATTSAFAASVDVLDRDEAALTGSATAFDARLAAAEQACRQRQPVTTAPMSKEVRQWSNACAHVATISARHRAGGTSP